MAPLKPTVLLVEDNDEDVFLLRRALRQQNIACELHVARDGQEAVDYFSGTGIWAERPPFTAPALMLLDLKLPFVSGFEVLEWISRQEPLKGLRVIVLTSSGEDRDVAQATHYGVHAYHVKPPSRELTAAVAAILQEACSGAVK